jgi:hypothetical protein
LRLNFISNLKKSESGSKRIESYSLNLNIYRANTIVVILRVRVIGALGLSFYVENFFKFKILVGNAASRSFG